MYGTRVAHQRGLTVDHFSLPHPHFFLKGEVKGWDTCSDGDSGETWKRTYEAHVQFFLKNNSFPASVVLFSMFSLPELFSLLCIFLVNYLGPWFLPTVSVPLCLCLSCLTYAPRVLFFFFLIFFAGSLVLGRFFCLFRLWKKMKTFPHTWRNREERNAQAYQTRHTREVCFCCKRPRALYYYRKKIKI